MDNYLKPGEIKTAISNSGCVKSARTSMQTALLAFLAGVFISFAAYFATVVLTGEVSWYGLKKLMSGIVFSTGLILVIIPGAELFTGNNLMIISVLDKKITLKEMFKNWGIVYAGNALGALFTALLIVNGTGLVTGPVAETAVKIAAVKASIPASEAFFRGIAANWLVCLAVMTAAASRDITGKILGILFPVTAFVAMGFEHSIANMYFLPAGFITMNLSQNPGFVSDYQNILTVNNILKNISWVTLGNITGGAFFTGILYWYIYKPADETAEYNIKETAESRKN